MRTVTSSDGTTIAFDRLGQGPAIIPDAHHRTLEGQTHEAAAQAIAPVSVEFFVTPQESNAP